MAKGSRGRRISRQFRLTPYPLPSCKREIPDNLCTMKCSKVLDKKEWEDATCSVCMEYPHNAVLLLCSSHDKGCRPYMCGTSFRHSNCLDQYKESAYKKAVSSNDGPVVQESIGNLSLLPDSDLPNEKDEVTVLSCPLCRGQVKGWTVVKPAREYLNAKKRGCSRNSCLFMGNYKELRKHVRAEHPSGCPRDVDPALEQKWRRLEWQREREDVMSAITSAMPNAMFYGDYVIEGNNRDYAADEEVAPFDADGAEGNGRFQMNIEAVNFVLLLHAVRQGNDLSRRLRPEPDRAPDQNGALHTSPVVGSYFSDHDGDNERYRYSEGDEDGISLVSRLHRHGNGRVLLNRSGRRRRRRAHSGPQ